MLIGAVYDIVSETRLVNGRPAANSVLGCWGEQFGAAFEDDNSMHHSD